MQNQKSSLNVTYILIAVVAVFVGIFYLARWEPNKDDTGNLDGFAQCLSEKEIVMYGAEWCSYCKKEKKAFGKSFKYVEYVECPNNTDLCLAKGIEGFPTWIFPVTKKWAEGKKLVGLQGIEKLSRESGCKLPTLND